MKNAMENENVNKSMEVDVSWYRNRLKETEDSLYLYERAMYKICESTVLSRDEWMEKCSQYIVNTMRDCKYYRQRIAELENKSDDV